MSFKIGHVCSVSAVAVVCLSIFGAQATEPYQEYRKRIESSQNLTALKSDLFGESVSLYNGKTEFSATDINVPGNSALPVRLQRRFNVEIHLTGTSTNFNSNIEGAGAWDIDVPYISGTFPGSGWSDQRCSGSMVPSVPAAFMLTDVWQGNTVHIPGDGDRTMLGLESQTPKPSDGVGRKWTTSQRDAIDCIPMQSGLTGEGYRITTTSGIRYYFDIATSRLAGIMQKKLGSASTAQVSRTKIYLLASKVEDRFGNTVQYQYNADGHPTRIWSSDGREISLSYNGAQLSTATSAGRSWVYGYGTVEGQVRLTSVTMPDGSSWGYAYSNALSPEYIAWDGNSNSTCSEQPPAVPAEFSFSVTHPSGAVGNFQFSNTRRFRSGVHMSACIKRINNNNQQYYYELATPNFFDVVSLYSKTITGPGLSAPLKWTYSYGGGRQSLWGTSGSAAAYPCTTCPTEKEVVLTNPDQTKIKYRYGFLYALNEGRLLGSTVLDASGNVVSVSRTDYMTTDQVANQPFAPRYGIIYNGDDPSTAQVRPVIGSSKQQAGDTYTSVNNSFDAMARVRNVTLSSPWHSRTNTTEYYDDTGRWILGQVAKLSNDNSGLVVSQTSYDGNAMPYQAWAFGKLQQTLSYNADGTLASVKDGNNQMTALSSWKRGVPQSIGYADGSHMTANVDDNGWISSVTDQNGYVTSYGYDAMGRVASINYPSGDSVPWNAMTQSFQQVQSDEYGLGAGHWRQTISTGNANKVTYFDAFWQPIVTREYDAASTASTQRFQRFAYDYEGRITFSSYPGSSDALSTGTWNTYDALGRKTSVSQDSELGGALTTLTEYLPGNQTRVTDPRGNKTLTGYQVFDQPDYTTPVWIQHPEGASTDISRDLFGKPLSIRRHDANGTLSVTRSYVYDTYQQLCKTVEPETGATANGYDAAGNLVWSAAGLSLPSTTSCDADSAFASGRRVDRSYDVRNRIKALSFPDGNGNQAWSYWPDGAVKQITTTNNGVATYNSYAYNKRRLLIAESQGQADGETWALGYAYDANGNLAAHRYPSGQAVDYAPNALGQPTQAGSYATGVSYYPNGAIKQFTYGNGIVHTLTQNARQLPDTSQDAYGGMAFLSDGYDYDANGNVAAISDGATGRNQRGNRTMTYDGMDRLIKAESPMFGTATYSYDVLDNLTHVVAPGRDHYYCYDANWQLTNVKTGSCGGSTVIGMSYDSQGNLSNKNGQAFVFDYGNRLRQATGKETYRYDGNGRRTLALQSAGNIGSLYDQSGALRFQKNQRQSKSTDYILLGGSLVAEADWPLGQTLSVKDYVNWNPVSGATRYVVEESVDGVTWTSVYDGGQGNWTSLARPAGTYSYRVTACTADGNCTAVSNVTHDQRPAVDIVPLLYQLLLNG
ncbi:RHS repeat protein [uncultured Xanthomonas sp.]|uniref:RHS repeat domain-containing protein n=1 Tax=uncultured Xanthomonas sp. TaxID=152831 RepID=UPI0025DE53C2|nr:RHS repeat protein [uncultured Xanthomonas sp.]